MSRWKLLLWSLGIVCTLTWLNGCSAIRQESFGSAWTEVNVSVATGTAGIGTDTTALASGTVPATQSASISTAVTVLPALAVLEQGESTPISVKIVSTATGGTTVTVAMSSTLGGTFDPAKGAAENGSFLTIFTAPSAKSGLAQIIALAGDVVGSCPITVTTMVPSSYQVQVVPAAALVMKGRSLPVSVRVFDQNGTGMTDGEVVMYQSLDGSFDPARGSLSQGAFSTTFTPKTATGTCEISALVKGLVGSCTVTVTDQPPIVPDSLQVSIVPALVALGQKQTTPLTVRVVNQRGEPVSGTEVLLVSSLEGTFDSARGTTTNGLFSTSFTSGTTGGLCTLTAQANGTSGQTTIQITVLPSITISPMQATIGTGQSQPISVRVQDDRGNLLSGVKVAIISQIGGSFNETFGETSNGQVFFTYTAPALPGLEVITVQALGVTATTQITVQ